MYPSLSGQSPSTGLRCILGVAKPYGVPREVAMCFRNIEFNSYTLSYRDWNEKLSRLHLPQRWKYRSVTLGKPCKCVLNARFFEDRHASPKQFSNNTLVKRFIPSERRVNRIHVTDNELEQGTVAYDSDSGDVQGEWEVDAEHHRMRVDRFVFNMLRDSGRPVNAKRIARAVRSGDVIVNHKAVTRPQYFVKRGDSVRFASRQGGASLLALKALDWGARVLHEDASMVVVDKPAGLASAPAPGEKGAHVVALLESFLSARDGAAVTLANVHRLDKETSGVLVLSKNSAAARVLGKEFKGRRVDKTYWAALYGNMDDSPIRWEDMLLSRHGRSRVVVEDGNAPASGPAPRKAVLHGKVTEHIGKKISIMEIDLRTGRLHQIRVQAASRGHFVLGDTLYGKPSLSGIPRLCLHCSYLRIADPSRTGERLFFEAPLPADMQDMLAHQRQFANGRNVGDSSN